jgi:hypothetical protein
MEDRAPSGADHPLVGRVLDERFRVDALLGEGGMGAVYRAHHLTLDRPIAIKVLHPHLCDDEQVSKRFDREALAISKLDHPNCVRVIDFGTTSEGMKYLVMPFLEGKELSELTGVALPPEEVVELGVQILLALEHAHKRGLVHRDLKPENIFLVRDDNGRRVVKLVDFGLVKLLETPGLEQLTRAGMVFGTPAYMSPEQAVGGKIDERTDLYSLGVVLYELLTGAPPFQAEEPGVLLTMHMLNDPPGLPDTVPGPLAALVLKLLSKEADERYATAGEVREALVATGAGAASRSPTYALVLPLPDAPAVAPHPAEGPGTAIPVRSGGTLMVSLEAVLGAEGSGGAAFGAPSASSSGSTVFAPPGAAAPMPASGGHPLSHVHRTASVTPAPRPASARLGVIALLLVVLSLCTWALIARLRESDERVDAAKAGATAPADEATPTAPVGADGSKDGESGKERARAEPEPEKQPEDDEPVAETEEPEAEKKTEKRRRGWRRIFR